MDRNVFSARDRVAVVCAIILAILWFSIFGLDAYLNSRPFGIFPGFGVTVFTAALFGTLLGLLGKRAHLGKATISMLAVVIVLSAIPALYYDQVLRMLDCLVLLGASIVEICLLSGLTPKKWYEASIVGSSINRFLRSLFVHCLMPLKALVSSHERSAERGHAKGVAVGVLLAAGVLVVVFPLLMSADLVFARLVNLGDLFSHLKADDVWKVIRVLLLAPLLFSLLFAAMRDGEPSDAGEVPAPPKPEGMPLQQVQRGVGWADGNSLLTAQVHNVTLIVMFAIIDAVYLLFSGIQFVYLFGGVQSAAMSGGYAEYARSGFFQLCAVAIVNLALLMWAARYMDRGDSRVRRIATQAMLILLLAVTTVMLVSAAYRMQLYISVFGMSLLRALTAMGMVFIAILIAAAVLKVIHPRFRFFKVFLTAGLALWIAFNLSGVDGRIASYNVDHYLSGDIAQIDIAYLEDLSPSTLPALERLTDKDDRAQVEEGRDYWMDCSRNGISWQKWSLDMTWPSK